MNMIFITINIIFGICLGLYFKNIALFVFIIYLIFLFMKKIKKKIVIFGLLICIFFYFYSYKTMESYEISYKDNQKLSREVKNN